jgi:hypothetical protein
MKATLIPRGSRAADPKPNDLTPMLCVPAISSREEKTRVRCPQAWSFKRCPGIHCDAACRVCGS